MQGFWRRLLHRATDRADNDLLSTPHETISRHVRSWYSQTNQDQQVLELPVQSGDEVTWRQPHQFPRLVVVIEVDPAREQVRIRCTRKGRPEELWVRRGTLSLITAQMKATKVL